MTQSVWRGQSVTVDPASVAPRPNEVIAGLNRQSVTPFTLFLKSERAAPRLNEVIAGLDPAIHDAVHSRLSQSVRHRVPTRSLPGSTLQSMMPFTLV